MIKLIRHFILPSVVSLCSIPTVSGQVMRVAIQSPHAAAQSNYVDVYEYDYVDVPPQFPGGERGLINYINKTRVYPYDAYKANIEDRVICSFIVNTDGSVCNINVLRGAHSSLNDEAVRIIKEMPSWKAGKIDNREVPVHCILPIAFRL